MKRNAKRGFTLIELLVVIAIIGILSSVVLASLNSARQKSRDARRLSDVKQIQLALELYYDANAGYPTALAVLAPTYIAVVPTDPQTSTAYEYAGLGGSICTSYHLTATLEDAGHSALDSDSDAAAGTQCTGSIADVSGVDTSSPRYDVKP